MFISTPYINWMHVKYENKVTCKYWILHVGEESFCCMFLWLLIVHPESYDVKNCIMSRKHSANCSNSFSNEDWVLHLSFLSKNEKIHIHMFNYYSDFVLFSYSSKAWTAFVWYKMIWIRVVGAQLQNIMYIVWCVIVDAKNNFCTITQIFDHKY